MKTLYIIGREPDCDIILWNNEISRHHAQIRIDQNGKLWLMDMSLNGTYLNGMLIAPNQEVEVSRKDEITFAGLERLDWNMIPAKKNKLLWVILSISILIVLATIVTLCLVFIPDKSKEAEVVTLESIETIEQPKIEENKADSIAHVDVTHPVKAEEANPKASAKKKDADENANKIVNEIYKNRKLKKEQSSSNDNRGSDKTENASSESSSTKENQATVAEDSTTNNNVIDAIF